MENKVFEKGLKWTELYFITALFRLLLSKDCLLLSKNCPLFLTGTVMYCGTHSDHILIPEPYKTKFFEGLRNAVLAGGDIVEFRDTYVLYLTKKPE